MQKKGNKSLIRQTWDWLIPGAVFDGDIFVPPWVLASILYLLGLFLPVFNWFVLAVVFSSFKNRYPSLCQTWLLSYKKHGHQASYIYIFFKDLVQLTLNFTFNTGSYSLKVWLYLVVAICLVDTWIAYTYSNTGMHTASDSFQNSSLRPYKLAFTYLMYRCPELTFQ